MARGSPTTSASFVAWISASSREQVTEEMGLKARLLRLHGRWSLAAGLLVCRKRANAGSSSQCTRLSLFRTGLSTTWRLRIHQTGSACFGIDVWRINSNPYRS